MRGDTQKSSIPFSKRLLAFLKDWGPALTVLYAIGYTLPHQLFSDIFTSPVERNLETARRTLADALAINDEWAKQSKAPGKSGPLDIDEANSAYWYKLRIAMDSGYDAIKRSVSRFGTTELMVVGNLFATSGEYDRSIEFLNIARSRLGSNHFGYAALFIALGSSEFRTGDNNSFAEARLNYLEGIKLYAEGKRLGYTNQALYYFQAAGGLAIDEAYFGNFECAVGISNELAIDRAQFVADDGIQQYMSRFLDSQRAWVKRGDQSAKGCGYELPAL